MPARDERTIGERARGRATSRTHGPRASRWFGECFVVNRREGERASGRVAEQAREGMDQKRADA